MKKKTLFLAFFVSTAVSFIYGLIMIVPISVSGYAVLAQPDFYLEDLMPIFLSNLSACVLILLCLSRCCRKKEHLSEISEYDDEDREQGVVKWFNITKGFGFITRDQGDDIFVHYRAIRGGRGRRGLDANQKVSFVVIDSDKGLQADDVFSE